MTRTIDEPPIVVASKPNAIPGSILPCEALGSSLFVHDLARSIAFTDTQRSA